MLSAVITALLLGMMLLIIASLIINALYARRRQRPNLANQLQIPSHPLDRHVTMILHVHDGAVVNVEKPETVPIFTLPPSWYARNRTLVSISFLLMLFLALFMQSGLADGAFKGLSKSLAILSSSSSYTYAAFNAPSHPLPLTASQRIVRIDSAARNQYYTDYQWNVWSYASCSGISMEEVMNAYGRNYIAADVLQVEQDLGVWNTYQGLIGREPAIAKTASHFGFKVDPHPPRTLQDLIYITNKGFPVIVGIPGHILVVRGGDSHYVYLVDSAPANRKMMTHSEFLALWDGMSSLLTPQ